MKITDIRIYLLVMVCSLKSITSFGQPVIKVPHGCEVVVAGSGTGASTGFGGAVGDGGIVVMSDPFDFPGDEGNFFYVSNGFELIQWELLGDLSMQTETKFNEPQQPMGAINPVNIQSYNKNLRFGEMPSSTLPNLDPRWARSKGRIVVTYFDKRCISKIKFDVYKRYKSDREKNLVPPILGADCVLPNTVYTFSVDPIASDNANDEIGFDRYYWSGLPEGCQQLFSAADNSSITFSTGNSVYPFTIQCCYGRANEWDGDAVSPEHTTYVTKNVGGQLTQPNYAVAPPSCVPTGQASFLIVYPDPISGQNYAWTSTNSGWTFNTSASLGTTTLTVNTGNNNNSGQLTLTIMGTCNSVIFNYQIDRNFAAPLFVIPTGATTTCIASTSTVNTYTVSPTTSNSIIWSIGNLVPTTLTGITLDNATSSTVTVKTSGTATGSFTLYATSGTTACNTTSVSTTIYVRPVTPVFTNGTPSCVARSSTAISTVGVTPISGAISYDWTPLPAGVTCTNCTTANPTFVFNSAVGVNSVTLTVKAIGTNSCAGSTTTKVINYITVATNFSGGTFNDQYAVSGTCGPVTSWTLTTSSGSTTYTATSGNITITGANNNNLQVSGTTGLALTTVCANLASGIIVCVNLTGATNTQRPSNTASNSDTKEESKNVKITPNPNSGTFSIHLTDFNDSASATLTDFSGNEIQMYTLRKGETIIEKEGLKKGTYFVVLRVDGQQEARQVIIK